MVNNFAKRGALVVVLIAGLCPAAASAQTEAPKASPPAQRGGIEAGAGRDGAGCRQDLTELDGHFEKNGLSRKVGAAGSGGAQSDKLKYEQLREAARTLAANGRYDACRMLVYEIRAIWEHAQSPINGTNSP